MSHYEFLNRLPKDINYKIKGVYDGIGTKILIEDKYGDLMLNPQNMIKGVKPSIKSAINKSQYYINLIKEVHNNFYNYDKFVYKTAREKSIITCPIHGDFEQTPDAHLNGQGCKECKRYSRLDWRRLTNEKFLDKVLEVHKNLYKYPNLNINGNKNKIDILCKEHGIFKQSPNSHMRGRGCPKCANDYNSYKKEDYIKKSKGRKTILYTLKIYNKNENFIKIGITFNSVKIRYQGKRLEGYNYEVIKEIIFDRAEEAFDKELELKRKYKEIRYTPLINFKGYKTECFNNKILEDEIYKY